MSNHVVIIGGGPAGIEAARAAAQAGGKVTIVSEGPVGGRAGWHSLLPSKVWLTAADTLGLLSEAASIGLSIEGDPQPSAAGILKRIKQVADIWNSEQMGLLNALQVTVLTGSASFESENRLAVKNSDGEITARLEADAFIIATGSVPFFPPELKPDGKRVIAPRFASHLEALPADIVVIGAGPTGSEFVYLFNRLGVKVTWIVDQYGVLPAFAPLAGRFLAETLVKRGVNLVADQLAVRIEYQDDGVVVETSTGDCYRAAMAFVAIGRFPDLSRLSLDNASLPLEPRTAVPVDEFGRTKVKSIYAVGDAAGAPMIANRAMAQAWVAGRHAVGADVPSFRAETVIYATYTEPQVAQVGLVSGKGVYTLRLPFHVNLKAHLLLEPEGFVELAYFDDRRVAGGVAVGVHAADVLAPVALAVQQAASIDDLTSLYGAHPTLSELAFTAARLAM